MNGVIDAKEAEAIMIPKEYNYEYNDFLGDEPYEKLYSLSGGSQYILNREVIRVADRARKVGFKNFKSQWKKYLELMEQERKQNLSIVPNQTEFDDQLLELNCGEWTASDYGIFRRDKYGATEYACTHPIMPIERLVNIDTGEVKIRLAYKRPGMDKKWQFIVIGKETASDPKLLNKTLSAVGISVNQKSAPVLMEYLTEIEDKNYDSIPESKSIGRLGYIQGEGFSPYVDNLVFDGDASYRHLYSYVKSHGSEVEWYKTAIECRKMSVTARIILASSFASPILSIVGSLPFFVHMWGGSGTGKTVALMLAASVWADPLKGRFVQTFNATRVGQEMTAAFLNHLPMCIDELQLTKNGKGQSNFDVYQLAEGVGRTRGKKSGGIEITPTWDCCFLTTGEDPIIGTSSGGGAVNRVIEIECISGKIVIDDGPRIAASLKQNYGYAGETFIKKLYSSEKNLEQVKEIYQEFFLELSKNDTTDKQALAAAAILTADLLATGWIFKDDNNLTVDDIKLALVSRESSSPGARAYSWICNWVAENENRFYTDAGSPTSNVYGKIEGYMAYINNNVLSSALNEAGFNSTATYSYLKTNNLIETRSGKGYGKSKRIGSSCPYCIYLRLPMGQQFDETDDDLL